MKSAEKSSKYGMWLLALALICLIGLAATVGKVMANVAPANPPNHEQMLTPAVQVLSDWSDTTPSLRHVTIDNRLAVETWSLTSYAFVPGSVKDPTKPPTVEVLSCWSLGGNSVRYLGVDGKWCTQTTTTNAISFLMPECSIATPLAPAK